MHCGGMTQLAPEHKRPAFLWHPGDEPWPGITGPFFIFGKIETPPAPISKKSSKATADARLDGRVSRCLSTVVFH